MFSAGASHLRVREGHEHHRVTFVELFFDLVFVFAVTQLSHRLIDHLTPLGALQTAMLMVAVWWVWVDTTWVTNWIDPEKPPVRAMLFALMLAGLVLSASIPRAFEDRGLAFAFALAFMQVVRTQFVLWCLKLHDGRNYRNFRRTIVNLDSAHGTIRSNNGQFRFQTIFFNAIGRGAKGDDAMIEVIVHDSHRSFKSTSCAAGFDEFSSEENPR
jgi:low temperature requirement protein LtrA